MLKLTNESGGDCYVNPAKVFAVVTGTAGQTTILSTDLAYIGVKESAEDVARMVDEANIPGLLRTGKAWTPPEGTPVPNSPYGVRIVPLGTGLDGTNLNDVRLGD